MVRPFMARKAPPEPPPCYAMVLPGLEAIAADEIERELHGKIRKTGPGRVVFRVPDIDRDLLRLRTVEDVFLLAWGTDQLTYRAEDLPRIRRWTAREVDWNQLLRIHHAIRPKPKGRPTYHLVTQMNGTHGYRRMDAREALAQGLAGKFPASWRYAEENASVEVWLTIDGATAVCGLRLSDRTMRHRTYKREHLPASLRPTLAAAMVRLAHAEAEDIFVDPMCGAGTILGEQLELRRLFGRGPLHVFGGDIDRSALRAADGNLRRLGSAHLCRWDATRLPLADRSVDCIVSNPPFGKQLSRPEDIGPLYRHMVCEYQRVLRAGGRAVLLVSDTKSLQEAARLVNWRRTVRHSVRVLGQQAALTVWQQA